MSSSLSKNTESYNNSGVFLQADVIKKFNKYSWSTDIEYPVTIAPFITDPTHNHGNKKLPNGHIGAYSVEFVNSFHESQNISQISERSIDVIAARSLNDSRSFVACIECKKLNPKYTEWCFFQHQEVIVPHLISKSMQNIGRATLFHVPQTERYGNEIYIQLNAQYNKLDLLPKDVVDYGIALTNEELWNSYYKTEQTVVDEACRQVIEGTYGLIIDGLKHQIINGDPNEYAITSIYFPIVVTNTQLKICEYDKNSIDSATGKLIKEPNFKDVDSVLLEYNSPKNVRFPEPIFSRINAEMRKATSKWHVLIMTPKGLENFLSKCKEIWG